MNHLIERFKAETPIFWKKVQRFMVIVGGIATAVWTINAQMGLNLDVHIVTVCKYVLVACAAVTLSSQFTINKPIA